MVSAILLWLFSVVEQMLYQISLNQEELKRQYRNLFKEVKELKDLRAKERDVPGEIPEDIHLPVETMETVDSMEEKIKDPVMERCLVRTSIVHIHITHGKSLL